MGKGTDKLYITHSEWSSGDQFSASAGAGVSGKGVHQGTTFKRLPFNFCAVSLQPFSHPVCTKEGTVFDLTHIVPWLKKNGTNPVNGKPLDRSELIKLNFIQNEDREYCDPVTYKPFTDNTHIVALGNTGNVFAWDTIERLNIKAKTLRDLLTDEPFSRKDIVTLQDPQHPEARTLTTFNFLKQRGVNQHATAEQDDAHGKGSVTSSRDPTKLLKAREAVAQARAHRIDKVQAIEHESDQRHNAKSASAGTFSQCSSHTRRNELTQIQKNVASHTSGKAAASFTSTGLTPHTSGERAMLSEEDYILKPRRVKEKGFARIETTYGSIIVELETEFAPRAVWNFVQLAKQGYYKNVPFHRNIRDFMLQGGDPTGTGRGGKSVWGRPFGDEWPQSPLKHDSRGTLSMANKGRDTNTSQFFITYRPCAHLDRKHTIFGHVVENEKSHESEDTLGRLEALETDSSHRPSKTCEIQDVIVFVDPFEEYLKTTAAETVQAGESKSQGNQGITSDKLTWTGKRLHTDVGDDLVHASYPAVGEYLSGLSNDSTIVKASGHNRELRRSPSEIDVPLPKKRKGGGFGSFEGW